MAYSELSKPIQNKSFNFNGLELILVVARLWVCIQLCENIRIFIKNHWSTNPWANKVVYGPCEQESEEKNSKFFNMQNRTFVKKKIASDFSV